MIPQSKASRITDDVVAAGWRDGAYRKGFARPLPHWFEGPQLDGLSNLERRVRFDAMSRRALRDPRWVLVTLVPIAAIVVPGHFLAGLPIAALATWSAATVLVCRHVALRRQWRPDVRAFASPESSGPRDSP